METSFPNVITGYKQRFGVYEPSIDIYFDAVSIVETLARKKHVETEVSHSSGSRIYRGKSL
jgi:hypothetical protein